MDLDAAPLPQSEIARIARRIDRPVVLVGMMGVGKSTVGRKLAALLGCSFTDADEEIEQAAQMRIAEIFERYGEATFRSGERRVIARLMGENEPAPTARQHPRRVLATGGGAFVDPATRALILERAIAVWLDCPIEILVERVARKGSRPLLRGADPRDVLTRLGAERLPAYSQAPIRVVSGNAPHQVTAQAILRAIDRWLDTPATEARKA